MTLALTRSVMDSEFNFTESVQWPKAPVTPHRKEAVLRALSDLEAMKRKDEPEVAHEVVSRHLDHQIEKQRLPSLIAEFLQTHWRSYMTRLYLLEGEESEPWRKAIENTENLTWSLQPKGDKASRQRLYGVLPELFQWLHAILQSQQVAVPDEDTFFSGLARLHAAALKSDTRAVAVSAPDPSRESPADDNPVSQWLDEGDGAADSTKAEEPIQSQPDAYPVPEEKPEESTAGSNPGCGLVIGSRVEFQRARVAKRTLRVEWISKGGGVYLFRDQKRGDALCLTLDRCIECLNEGSARLLND